jgi:hypothetical protein
MFWALDKIVTDVFIKLKMNSLKLNPRENQNVHLCVYVPEDN